ncbi:MAG: M14 family metallopeptidase [Cellulosilyticaceae bacterium]
MRFLSQFKPSRFIKILTTLCIMGAFLLLGAPPIMRHLVQPEDTPTDSPYADSFRTDYTQVRAHLADQVSKLQDTGYLATLSSYAIDVSDDLYIDTIFIPPTQTTDNLILITTGVHGIEGYIGATMLDVFMDQILPTLDTTDTGVLIVANVNPYGMKYKRRYNEHNVDLNRNFIYDWSTFDLATNTDYPVVSNFLEPQNSIGNMLLHEMGFYGSLAKEVITSGVATLSNALLGGQYQFPNGVYYGGTQDEASTRYLKSVFKESLHAGYSNLIHLDLHSGYGPRYAMTIFNSSYEQMTEAETKATFGYDTVIAYDSEDFYPTTGDTTEYFYRLAAQEQTPTELYSTCFEFGTLGDDFPAMIRSMKYTIDENRNHFFPSSFSMTDDILNARYMEMFYPSENTWRQTAISHFLKATEGVLKAKLQ